MTGKDALKKLRKAGLYARLRRSGSKCQLFAAIGVHEVSFPILADHTNAKDEDLPLPVDVRRLESPDGRPFRLFKEIATITEDPDGWLFSGTVGQLDLEISFTSFDEAVQALEDWFRETPEFGDRTMSLEVAIQSLASRGFETNTNYRGSVIGGVGPRGEISRSQRSYGIIRHGSFLAVVLPSETMYQSVTSGVRWLAQAVQHVFSYYGVADAPGF